ncbi:MAG: hypothetical protein QF464_11425, partial [Myxococcota bacterium]|nr:hypothetical protein [Myxococcota bacterium]
MASGQGKWSAIGLWVLVIFCVSYSMPTMVGSERLPEWFNEMFDSKLAYGLDLQGGLELRYTVDWETAIEDNGRKLGDSVKSSLADAWAKKDNKNPNSLEDAQRKAYKDRVDIEVPDHTAIRVKFKDGAQVGDLPDSVLASMDYRYELSAVDATTYELLLLDEEAANIRDEAVKKTRQLISQRVEAFGLVDPDVRVAGDSDIVVQIPGVGKDQMDIVRQRIGQTAQLTFRMVDRNATYFAD